MKKIATFASAAAMVAGMTVAAAAQQAPINETPTQGLGGAGAGITGQQLAFFAALATATIIVLDDDDAASTTTTN